MFCKAIKTYWYALIPVIIAAPSIYAYFLFVGPEISHRSDDWSHFGSFISGIVGSSIALAALIALTIGIKIQKSELSELKKQMEKQDIRKGIESVKLTKQIMLEQFSVIKVEKFLGFDSSSGVSKNYRSISAIHQIILPLLPKEKKFTLDEDGSPSSLFNLYDEIHEEYQHYLDSYFRSVYNYISTLDRAKKTHPDIWEEESTQLIEALSTDELILLFFNGSKRYGFRKMREKMIEYRVFKHLPLRYCEFLTKKLLQDYPSSVYGEKVQLYLNQTESNP